MALTAFPKGISSFGIPVIGSGSQIPASNGNYYFVSSVTGSNSNNGTDPGAPLATVAAAITASTVSHGDVIVMLPYHTETIAAAGGWTPLAGTAIVGLGWGGARPLITFSATASTILCSAANLFFQNFVITAGIAEVVTLFSVSGADCTINGVDHKESNTSYTLISYLTSTAAADRLTITNCKIISTTVCAGTAAGINMVGGTGITITDNYICMNKPNSATACAIASTTTANADILIARNYLNTITTGAAKIALSLYSGSTGNVYDNRAHSLGSTLAGNFGIANCGGGNNYVTHAATKSGLLDPVVDS
jgi:hypothetical protein